MTRNKVMSYLGFAARSRNIVSGYNTCEMMISKGKIKLLIIAEDMAENTKKKMIQKCSSNLVEYRIFATSDELSQITGTGGKGLFGITDSHFAKIIVKEIDLNQSEREVY